MTILRRLVVVLLLGGLAGCTFPELRSPTPRPTPSPTAAVTRTPSPSPSPTASVEPTPDFGAVPSFGAGEIILTAIDGLRARQRPGESGSTIAPLLPLGAELQVVMGPIPVGEFGWYLVTDVGRADLEFEEAWIAAGFEPEPFLRSSGRVAERTPSIAAFALTGDAEYGPIEIADEDHAIRWMATDPEGVRCRFGVQMTPASGEPVTAIRATIGDDVVPGTLQPSFFAAQPDLRGQVFLTVESDCAWTLVVTRVPPPEDPSPAPDDD